MEPEQQNHEETPEGISVIDAIPVISWIKYIPWALALILLVGVLIQSNRLAHSQTDIEKMKGAQTVLSIRNSNLQNELNKCKGEIATQNKEVTDAGKASEKVKQDFDAYKKTFDTRVQTEIARRVKLIKDQPTPKTCEEAEKFLRDNIGNK